MAAAMRPIPELKEEEEQKNVSNNTNHKSADGCDDLDEIFHDFDENDAENDAHFNSNSDLSLKEQLQKDQGEGSLRKWKQKLFGSTVPSAITERKRAEVEILSLSVMSPGRPDVVLPVPFTPTTAKNTLFTLKQGCKYRIKFHFVVLNNIVSGLNYTYDVWKSGLKVDRNKFMMGKFSARKEPYTFELEEGTTPTFIFARGSYCVRSRFMDEDGKCYLDTTYYFDIRKDWGSRDKC